VHAAYYQLAFASYVVLGNCSILTGLLAVVQLTLGSARDSRHVEGKFPSLVLT